MSSSVTTMTPTLICGHGVRFRSVAAATALLACGAWIVLRLRDPAPWFPLDDPYITLHAAHSLHLGADPNFRGVPPLAGGTSAPFLALVYVLLFLLPGAMALSAACWAGAILYALGLLRTAFVLKLPQAETAAVLAFGLLASFVPFHLVNGLETSWVMAAVAWSLAFTSERRPTPAAVCAGIAGAFRPEFVLYAALLVLALGTRTRSWRERVLLMAAALLPSLPGALWYLQSTGSLVPETAAAKRFFFAEELRPLTWRLKTVGAIAASWALSCGIGLLACLRVRRSAVGFAALAFVALVVAVSALTLPSSLSWNTFRYVAPLAPIFAWFLARFANERGGHDRRRTRVLLLVAVAWAAALAIRPIREYRSRCEFARTELDTAAAWARSRLPPDAVVLLHDAGYFSCATPFRLVDMVGLKTPETIAVNRRLERQNAFDGHAEAIAEIAASSHATYMVLLRNWWDMDSVPDALRSMGWTLTPLRENGAYRVWRIEPPVQEAQPAHAPVM